MSDGGAWIAVIAGMTHPTIARAPLLPGQKTSCGFGQSEAQREQRARKLTVQRRAAVGPS